MTLSSDTAQRREQFIPVRGEDLERLLALSEFIPIDQRGAFHDLCRVLKSIFHFQYHEQLLELKNAYAAFDPDADTVRLTWPGELSLDEQVDQLFDSLVDKFQRANFRRLNREQIEQAFEVSSAWGLNLIVDFEIFDRLEIFSRGESITQHHYRDWRNFYRQQTKDVEVHQRLVIAFRLRSGTSGAAERNGSVVLKIFKEIPRGDLEMLLPGTRIRMTLLDRAKIALPTVSGLILSVYKIVRAGMVIAFAGAYGLIGFLGFIGGTIGYGIKSFFGYLRTKDKYQADLTRNLYFQNLDNNAGVLFRLLDEVEEQEFRESILAYVLLSRRNAPFGMTLSELDIQAEQLLLAATDSQIDFEADDAVNKLQRLGLVELNDGRYRAVTIPAALKCLDHQWDNVFQWANTTENHRRAA